jgi:hypothetical protein
MDINSETLPALCVHCKSGSDLLETQVLTGGTEVTLGAAMHKDGKNIWGAIGRTLTALAVFISSQQNWDM